MKQMLKVTHWGSIVTKSNRSSIVLLGDRKRAKCYVLWMDTSCLSLAVVK